jgi:hypothetical protein
MAHIHFSHIFIQLSIKSTIKFVRPTLGSLNLMVDLKMKCVENIFILFLIIKKKTKNKKQIHHRGAPPQ